MKINFLYTGQKIQLLTDWVFELVYLTWCHELAKLHNVVFNIPRPYRDKLCTVRIGKDSILTVHKIFTINYDFGKYNTISFIAQKNEIRILSTNMPITRNQKFRVPISTVNNLEVKIIN